MGQNSPCIAKKVFHLAYQPQGPFLTAEIHTTLFNTEDKKKQDFFVFHWIQNTVQSGPAIYHGQL